MSSFGNKEPWMEPMNKFLVTHRSDFKSFVDQVCSIPSERQSWAVSPSYATPIQILGRLPSTSREGFPSLPFLIDSARNFAALISLWLEASVTRMIDAKGINGNLLKFHNLCLELQQRTKDCLNKAEQAERPSGKMEVKWEELVEQIERSSTFYDESVSKPTTPSAETMMGGTATAESKRSSMIHSSRPKPALQPTEVENEEDEDTPASSVSVTWNQSRLPFTQQRRTETRESAGSSKNSSTYSLDPSEAVRVRQSPPPKDPGAKYRFFDFVGGSSRRKGKDRDGSQGQQEEPRNEF